MKDRVISLNAAIKRFQLWYSDLLLNHEEKYSFEDLLRELPSVKPQEPKTGHWEWLTEDKYRCSNCNHETRVDECMNEPMYDFCPFCGAKMVEPQESEDKK